ncbi:DNA-directed RNA polymerase subunit omega [Edaphobacter modestus]|uniref:DNA-directed RNA polymerase subunit omega n=1 Tax=Edaphobacter modestus TaxID=388466 RepID=A0A4Q7Z0T6_9BACT|nr:DNA-directed RNA polymerase subunit omega [Edaphobacter modestus]RZU43133.1 DNA-directed RNA polymerase subunit omega [Edaphobacter modestus]
MTDQSAFHNKYSLVKGAARRARQLQSGAPPLIVAKSTKACRVAQEEIKQGYVKFVLAKGSEPKIH